MPIVFTFWLASRWLLSNFSRRYIEFNEIPENYFQAIEQATFTPAHLVPGIGLSPDRVLQGRIFAYSDAYRYRLGVLITAKYLL